jgi:hypothetical protein
MIPDASLHDTSITKRSAKQKAASRRASCAARPFQDVHRSATAWVQSQKPDVFGSRVSGRANA